MWTAAARRQGTGISGSGKLPLRTSSAAAAFMRPCLATVSKQHGEKAPGGPQGPSSTVTHSWVLRRTLPPLSSPPVRVTVREGGVGGWEKGHMCAVLQASGRLHARRSSFSICFSEASPSEHRRGGFLRGDQHNARCRKTPGAQMTAVLIVRGEEKIAHPVATEHTTSRDASWGWIQRVVRRIKFRSCYEVTLTTCVTLNHIKLVVVNENSNTLTDGRWTPFFFGDNKIYQVCRVLINLTVVFFFHSSVTEPNVTSSKRILFNRQSKPKDIHFTEMTTRFDLISDLNVCFQHRWRQSTGCHC